ncbi:phage infection protein [Corynebacterium auriscanis]|uniref:phage infection protein n=1 Tax=Corynebacterium auriscanis TaxID=99807 RepID=UPI003CF4AE5A
MKSLKVELKNCHGIRELDAEFRFARGNAIAVYAPNGTMKTSFAQTFKEFAGGKESSDRMFPTRETQRRITDENGKELHQDDIVVVLSYDETLGPTESTSTLLVNAALRREYESIQADLVQARDQLVDALRDQSGTKQDVIATVSRVFTQEADNFFEALARVEYEVDQLEDTRFADLPYDVLFNEKVDTVLRTPGVQAELAMYVTRLNELLDESPFFNRTSFTFYNATNVKKSLGDNGFFSAKHSLLLHEQDGETARTVTSDADLKTLIAEEKKRITDDDTLRKKLDVVEKALQKNVDARKFFDFISSREELLPELTNVGSFKQKVWKAYLKENEDLYKRVVACFKSTEQRRKEIEQQAAEESTHWEKVIQIFNDRFFVPFRLSAENKHKVALGQEAMLKLNFKFEDGGESRGVERDDLLSVLSQGEKRALYILNVLFEIEARKVAGRETLFVIDDLADSFDYKNKYAIVQYLKEMADHTDFKLVLLTHNFDFFRTLHSRGVVSYDQCFMAQKSEFKVILNKAKHVNNPFIRGFKQNFYSDGMQRIASIPFVRNILEYTKGEGDPDYVTLTSLLHWKSGSPNITNADLDRIFLKTFPGQQDKAWAQQDGQVVDLLFEQADLALEAPEGVNFENKIVLSIATRILAEKYMIHELADPEFTGAIGANQTQVLFREFKNRGVGSPATLGTLDSVVLMTPENIHVNSFMYEPIIDMSDVALRDLYCQVKRL